MATITTNLTAYENPNVAYCNSWVRLDNDISRPLFAQATYLANASDISVSLSAESLNVNLADLETLQTRTNSLLNSVTSANINVPGFKIPPYDEINMNYVGSTNNLDTVVYKDNSTTVMTLSFAYIPQPPTIDNATLKTVKKI